MSYFCFHKKGPLWYCGNIARNQLKIFIQEHLILSNWRKRNFSEAFLHKNGRYAIEKEKNRFGNFFQKWGRGRGVLKSLPQWSRDGTLSVKSPFHHVSFKKVIFWFKCGNLLHTFIFFARIDTRYVVLGLRPGKVKFYYLWWCFDLSIEKKKDRKIRTCDDVTKIQKRIER